MKHLIEPSGRVVIKRILVFLMSGSLLFGSAQISPAQGQLASGKEFAIPLPTLQPQGLAWDGKHLYILAAETKKIHSLDPRSGSIIRAFPLALERAKGLAFDGHFFWVADEAAMKLFAIDPEGFKVMKTLNLEVPQEKGFKSLEGLAWDGKYLWVAYFAGFSSSLNQIDPASGKIITSVFTDCHPRGIASDGRYLWTICYNGEHLPAKIDRRNLGPAQEMVRSRKFLQNIEGRDPQGLMYDGEFLWYVDRSLKKALRVLSEETKER